MGSHGECAGFCAAKFERIGFPGSFDMSSIPGTSTSVRFRRLSPPDDRAGQNPEGSRGFVLSGVMPQSVVIDELHRTGRIPTGLPNPAVDAVGRTLLGRAFTSRLRRVVR